MIGKLPSLYQHYAHLLFFLSPYNQFIIVRDNLASPSHQYNFSFDFITLHYIWRHNTT